jgi:hypothetical protein
MLAIVSALIGNAMVIYRVGKWAGKISSTIDFLKSEMLEINKNLSNHIVHYDKELTNLRMQITKIEEKIKIKKV